jgi:hypothetical protein
MRRSRPMPESGEEMRLREIIAIVVETVPVMRKALKWQGAVAPEIVRRLETELRRQERILAIGLLTLNTLPDDPTERSEFVACSIRTCAQLTSLH